MFKVRLNARLVIMDCMVVCLESLCKGKGYPEDRGNNEGIKLLPAKGDKCANVLIDSEVESTEGGKW